MLRPLARAVAGVAFAAVPTLAACSPASGPTPPTLSIGAGAPAPLAVPAGPSVAASGIPSRKEAGPIVWIGSEPDALDRARRGRLPLLIWVRADWDAATLEMERRVWTDRRVREAARPFVALRLDVTEAEGDAERYAERYEVKGVPTTVVFDARGRRVEALVGFRDPEQLANALRGAAEE